MDETTNQTNQDEGLQFNLDVLTDGNAENPSLSDLYGIPVFTQNVGELSTKLAKDRDKKMNEMQKQVFFIKDESNKEVNTIKTKVFTSTVLAKDTEVVEEKAASPVMYITVSIILFCFIVIISVFYAKKKSKERKEQLETIDDFF